jgi:hypothetical protein
LSDFEFTKYAESQRKSDAFFYASGMVYFEPEQVLAYIYGSYQCSHEVHLCVDGLLKFLGKFDITTILAHTEINQILIGQVRRKWSSERHFSNKKRCKGPLDLRCICSPWYRHGHFVTVVL